MGVTEQNSVDGARPVRRAYQQVADVLRDAILTGELQPGEKLPSEGALSQQFRTSRGTVREALRLLSSENLVETRPGAHNGTRVAHPDVGAISSSIHGYLAQLVRANELTVEELVDSRQIIEAPAAAAAASVRTPEQLERLAQLLPDDPTEIASDDLYALNLAFHEHILVASGNRLLPLIMRPVFQAISSERFQRDKATAESKRRVLQHHRRIYQALADGDATAASEAMAMHLSDSARTYHHIQQATPC